MTMTEQTASPYLPVARVAHEVQRTVEASQGDHRTPIWEALTEAQQQTAVARTQAYIDSPDMTPVTAIGPTAYSMGASERTGVYAFYGAVRAIAQEQTRE